MDRTIIQASLVHEYNNVILNLSGPKEHYREHS